ncbi:MAG TPA: hypothetical protein VIM69_02255 [Opitutaceae bacterium]
MGTDHWGKLTQSDALRAHESECGNFAFASKAVRTAEAACIRIFFLLCTPAFAYPQRNSANKSQTSAIPKIGHGCHQKVDTNRLSFANDAQKPEVFSSGVSVRIDKLLNSIVVPKR